jgi:hypothetical protein
VASLGDRFASGMSRWAADRMGRTLSNRLVTYRLFSGADIERLAVASIM